MRVQSGTKWSPSLVAAVFGLSAGWAYFELVHPFLLGFDPHPVYEREAAIHFVFRGIPLIVLPITCLTVAALGSKTKGTAFKLGMILSLAWFIPIPLADNWLVWPEHWGLSPSDSRVVKEVTFLVLFQSILAVAVSTVVAFVSPALYQVLSKYVFRQNEPQS